MKLFLLVASLLAAQSAPVSALDCSQGGVSQSEMDECASRQLTSSDAKLNADYRKTLACLKPFDGHEKRLVGAQRAWLLFRDMECKFQGSASESGSVQPMIISLCLKKVTEDRIKQLGYYLTCQVGDLSCPTATCRSKTETKVSALSQGNISVISGSDGLILKTGPSAFDEHYIKTIDTGHFSDRVAAMNRSAADVKSSERIIRCERVVSISVGNEGGNISYGGICLVKRRESLMQVKVCNDELTGYFRVSEIASQKPTESDLGEFVGRFCWGG